MEEQEQQNEVQEEQNVQMEPTPVSEPPSHKKLIIGIVVGFVLAVAGVAGAYFVLQSKAQPSDEIVSKVTKNETEVESFDIYVNETFGYSLTIPNGYRLASDYMRWVNTTDDAHIYPVPVEDYSENKAPYVLLTSNTEQEEMEHLRLSKKIYNEIEDADADFSALNEICQCFSIRAFEISIEEIKEFDALAYELGIKFSGTDFKDFELSDGTKAIRHDTEYIWGTGIYEQVYIPLPTGPMELEEIAEYGTPTIYGIKIESLDSKGFNKRVFEQIIQSFKFNK